MTSAAPPPSGQDLAPGPGDAIDRDQVAQQALQRPTIRVAIALPSLASAIYLWVGGAAVDVGWLLITLLSGAVLVIVPLLWLRQVTDPDRLARLERTWQVVSSTVGVGMLVAFFALAVEADPAPFAPVMAVVVVAMAFTLPVRWRWPLLVWATVVWAAVLLLDGERSPGVLVLHLGGLLLTSLIAVRIADVVAVATLQAARERRRAEHRASLLTTVLGTRTLDPTTVLRTAVQGIADSGVPFSFVAEVDEEQGRVWLVELCSELGRELPPERPVEVGLLGRCVRTGREVLTSDASAEPDAEARDAWFRGAILRPLHDEGRVVAVLGAASPDGPLTDAQVETARQLSAAAAGALARARSYARDRATLEQLQQLDERTQDFVSTVSHELRTPLTVISGLGTLLESRWDGLDADQRTELLERIDANAERLGVMVRSLLDSSALEHGDLDLELGEVGLAALLADVADRLTSLLADHPVTVDVPAQLTVRVDAALLEHVVENLLTNVAKHTPAGTAVTITARRVGDRVAVTVADRGPGIPEADLPHVLERFYRGGAPTRRETGGLGLGLALARQIVEAHGGPLTVTSAPGRGTSFRFTVPAGS